MMRHTTAAQIDKAVREMYGKNGYTVLSEVRNGTGYEKSARTIDMMAISTWPSRGLFIEGIEIKRDRNDLRKELANPQKADALAKYCTWFWLAVPDDLLTPDMLIPETWGIITVNNKLKAAIHRKGAMLKPEALDALLVCSILRNFSESHTPVCEVRPMINAAVEAERKSAEANKGYRISELEKAIADFKEASGVDLMGERGHVSWRIGQIGEAVRLVAELHGRPAEELGRAVAALDTARAALLAGAGVMFPREFSQVKVRL